MTDQHDLDPSAFVGELLFFHRAKERILKVIIRINYKTDVP